MKPQIDMPATRNFNSRFPLEPMEMARTQGNPTTAAPPHHEPRSGKGFAGNNHAPISIGLSYKCDLCHPCACNQHNLNAS